MYSNRKLKFCNKHGLMALICALVYYYSVWGLLWIVGTLNNESLYSHNMQDSRLSPFDSILIRSSIVFLVAGILFCILSNIYNFGKVKVKLYLNIKRTLCWIIPGAVLILWYVGWWFLSRSMSFPYPIYGEGSRLPIPHFYMVLLLILGCTVCAPTFLFRRQIKYTGLFWPIVFFVVSVAIVISFQLFDQTDTRYTLQGYFFVFALYGGIGAFFGFAHYLTEESRQSGVWYVDWYKLIVWCPSSFVLILYDGLVHLNAENGLLRTSTLFFMFIFGNTIITSFYKRGGGRQKRQKGTVHVS